MSHAMPPWLLRAIQSGARVPLLGAVIEKAAYLIGHRARDWRVGQLFTHAVAEARSSRGDRRIRYPRVEGNVRLALYLGGHLWNLLYFRGMYEVETTAFVRAWLRPGDTLIDVGANVGYYAMMGAAQVGACGRVHAFEPHPAVARLLRLSVAANRFHDRVVVNEVAISASPGSVALYLPPLDEQTGEASIVALEWAAPERSVTVPATTLDAYCAQFAITKIDLVKVDVEGAELEVLRGAPRTLAELRPDAVICEFLPDRRPAASDALADLLIRAGYRAFALAKDGRIEEQTAPISTVWANLCFLSADGIRRATSAGLISSRASAPRLKM